MTIKAVLAMDQARWFYSIIIMYFIIYLFIQMITRLIVYSWI